MEEWTRQLQLANFLFQFCVDILNAFYSDCLDTSCVCVWQVCVCTLGMPVCVSECVCESRQQLMPLVHLEALEASRRRQSQLKCALCVCVSMCVYVCMCVCVCVHIFIKNVSTYLHFWRHCAALTH